MSSSLNRAGANSPVLPRQQKCDAASFSSCDLSTPSERSHSVRHAPCSESSSRSTRRPARPCPRNKRGSAIRKGFTVVAHESCVVNLRRTAAVRCRLAQRRLQPEMQIGVLGCHPASRCAHHEALLDQVWLDDILDRAALFADRRRQTLNANRPAVEFLNNRLQ